MPVKFDAALTELMHQLLEMAEVAKSMLQTVLRAISEGDVSSLQTVFENEKRMDGLQLGIDDNTVELIGIYTPVASDLRLLLMLPRITGALERMGDQAEKIAKNVSDVVGGEPIGPVMDLPQLGRLAYGMVKRSIDGFVSRSPEKTLEVLRMDLEVDTIRNKLLDGLVCYMEQRADHVKRGLHLMTIARAFERIGDQAVDIAEATIYAVTGKDVRHLHLERKAPEELPPFLWGRQQ